LNSAIRPYRAEAKLRLLAEQKAARDARYAARKAAALANKRKKRVVV
jgi:hypothetical protein